MSARVLTLLKLSLLLAPLALLPVVSCKGGGGGGGGGDQLTNALIACGLISAGQLPSQSTTTDPYENCVFQCVAGGTCAELEGWICGGDGEMLFSACATQCLEAHGHSCDGQLLPPYWVCDGSADCMDGSDEVDCPPPFACGDGTEIPPDWKCDGEADCANGSDEAGCPVMQTFMCGDGSQIPSTWQCDFEEDCSDGSDEAGCAMIVCPNSETSGAMSTTLTTLDTGDPEPIDTGDTGGLDTTTG